MDGYFELYIEGKAVEVKAKVPERTIPTPMSTAAPTLGIGLWKEGLEKAEKGEWNKGDSPGFLD